MNDDVKEKIRSYWENSSTISIIDENLHELEISVVVKYLQPSDCLADIGCGNGDATVRYAERVNKCIGFERSNALRAKAVETGKASGLTNLEFRPGDVLEMDQRESEFDAIVTQRMLINLASWDDQKQAMLNIHRMLKPGGRAILIENTNDANLALNEMRDGVGLPPIPQHWHNRFFDYDEFMAFIKGKFQVLKTHDFGLYYFLTRVYVQMFASFTGFGAGAEKDPIFEQSDRAARALYEKFADRIHIDGCRTLGPIQAFVLRREP